MLPFMMRVVCAVAVVVILAGCASTSNLAGEWRGESENARGSVLNFGPDGRLRWTVDIAGPMTIDATYRVDGKHLDITGFSAGPLRGGALYCIYQLLSPNRLQMDCERGDVGETSVRPATYDPKQTQIFVRK